MTIPPPESEIHFSIGLSMWPTIRPGDELVFGDAARIAAGDIVAYALGEARTVHRVVARQNCRFVTRGDNCPADDTEVIEMHHIAGKLTGVKRKGRYRRVRSGLLGLCVAGKCRMVKKLRNSLLPSLKTILFSPLFSAIRSRIPKRLLGDHLSVVRVGPDCLRLYSNNRYFGYYTIDRRQLFIRFRYELFITASQKERLLEKLADLENTI